MSKLQAALNLVASGYYVFPLHANAKRPVRDMAFKQLATRDTRQVNRWWAHSDCNIAIYCGRYGDHGEALLVLDIDTKNAKAGLASLQALEAAVSLPETAETLTASGGQHLIYRVAEAVKQGADVLGEGIDVRSRGGYIVAPGSVIDARAYQWQSDTTRPVAAPAALLRRLPVERRATAHESVHDTVAVNLDSAVNVQLAVDFLEHAEPAIEGAGGNDTTFRVAAEVRDYGISEATAIELLGAHYNERCSPPWPPDELAALVEHVYRYATRPAGCASPEADFQRRAPTVDPAAFQAPPWRPQCWGPVDLAALAPRPWLLGRLLLGEKVTSVVAPPGVGKSTWGLLLALAVATGRDDVAAETVYRRGPVLYINLEDDRDEMDRRRAAAMIYHRIRDDELAGLHVANASDPVAFTLASSAGYEGLVHAVHKDALIDYVREHRIELVIADPFVETHDCDENDNVQINRVGRLWREVAITTGVAVLLVHHTRKPVGAAGDGHIGSLDSGRGASALGGVVRVGLTLYGMTDADARQYGIGAEDRRRYVRLDDAKANLSLASPHARWYRKETVTLPNTDDVGVLARIDLRPVTEEQDELILATLERWLREAWDAGQPGEMALSGLARDLREVGLLADLSERTLAAKIRVLLDEPVARAWGWLCLERERPATRGRPKEYVFGKQSM